jgi:hypothetical protein
MMMRQTAIYLIAAAICIMFAMMSPVSGTSTEKASLNQLIEENRNINMDAEEMAFFLATHGYDATPKGNCVIVNVDGETCQVLPN